MVLPASAAARFALLLVAASVAFNGNARAGTLSTLTYNVAGLPQGLNPDQFPAVNTVQISPHLEPYALVLVQEDFNYHPELISQVTHPNQSVKDTNSRPPYPFTFGDGLNTLARGSFSDFTRITWVDCFGYFDNGSDCLTPKGFTVARHALDGGGFLDVYNLHADAGGAEGDLEARRSEFRQLGDFLVAHSAGNAVLLMGDTNSRYTRAGDILPEFLEQTGLHDVWVDLVRGGSLPAIGNALIDGCAADISGPGCERIDKILYRSGGGVELTPTGYVVPTDFVDSAGAQLSDHYPVAAVFEYALVPEPGTAALLAAGLASLGIRARRRNA